MSSIRYAARPISEEAPAPHADAPRMWARTLVTFYETDPEIIAAVLPRPLEPTDEPFVRVNVAEVDMPGTDALLGAAVVSVRCKHDDLVGLYDLTMVMTTEQAVVGGRETFGEPKKIGDVTLTRDGNHIVGKVTRMGVTYLEVHADTVETLPVGPTLRRTSFYYKFLMNPDGTGFDHDPSFLYVHRTEDRRLLERCDAQLILRDSPFDPVVDLPVRRIVSCEYSENATTQVGEIQGTVPQEWVLPFAHQRYDHLAPRRLAAGVSVPGL